MIQISGKKQSKLSKSDYSLSLAVIFANRTTPYSVYSPETYEGHWKQLTVRTTRTKHAMAMVFFNPQVMKC